MNKFTKCIYEQNQVYVHIYEEIYQVMNKLTKCIFEQIYQVYIWTNLPSVYINKFTKLWTNIPRVYMNKFTKCIYEQIYQVYIWTNLPSVYLNKFTKCIYKQIYQVYNPKTSLQIAMCYQYHASIVQHYIYISIYIKL